MRSSNHGQTVDWLVEMLAHWSLVDAYIPHKGRINGVLISLSMVVEPVVG